MQSYKLEITFTEPLLGTVALDPAIYEGYIGSNAPDEEALEEELATIPESEDKGITGFHRLEDDTPFLYDYHVKGFLKDACGMLRRVKGTRSAKIRAYKKIIDGLVFVGERRIPLRLPAGGEVETLSRPLRAATAQGERVALACSQTCPIGTEMAFHLEVLGEVEEETLREWFEYGHLRGFGQWRNASFGRFTYEMEALS